jgi:hypothetical protein
MVRHSSARLGGFPYRCQHALVALSRAAAGCVRHLRPTPRDDEACGATGTTGGAAGTSGDDAGAGDAADAAGANN